MARDWSVREIRGRVEDLTRLRCPEQIEFLHLVGAGVRSLEGVERCVGLRRLRCERLRDVDLSPLSRVPQLTELAMLDVRRLTNWESVVELPALTSLDLLVLTRSDAEAIAGLPFARLPLTRLELGCPDSSPCPIELDWLSAAPALRELGLFDFVPTARGWEAIKRSKLDGLKASVWPATDRDVLRDELREALPNFWIQLYRAVDWEGRVTEFADGWREVGYDLAGRWDLETTLDAVDRLEAWICEQDPALLEAVRLDPESSALRIGSADPAALQRVIDLIDAHPPE